MEEIRSIAELDSLREQITTARKKCKERPEMEKGTFLQRLLNDKPPKERECNEYNEKQYSTLPEEIKVTPEIGQVLQGLFLAHLQNQHATRNKLPTTGDAAAWAVKAGLTAIFPNPVSIGKFLYDNYRIDKKYDNYAEGMHELIRVADKNMQVVLGSYQLTKTDDGDFLLKRGKWFVGNYSKSDSLRAPEYKVWYTGLKDVGVDPNLATSEQKYLFEVEHSWNLRESPTVGLWDDENKQRHLYLG